MGEHRGRARLEGVSGVQRAPWAACSSTSTSSRRPASRSSRAAARQRAHDAYVDPRRRVRRPGGRDRLSSALFGPEHEIVLVDRKEHFSMGLRKALGAGRARDGRRREPFARAPRRAHCPPSSQAEIEGDRPGDAQPLESVVWTIACRPPRCGTGCRSHDPISSPDSPSMAMTSGASREFRVQTEALARFDGGRHRRAHRRSAVPVPARALRVRDPDRTSISARGASATVASWPSRRCSPC